MLGAYTVQELNRFMVSLALPALLFYVMANARLAEIWQPGFIASFTASALECFGLMLALGLSGGQSLSDATIDALSAGHANVGYIGLPVTLAALGHAALVLTTIAAIVTVYVVFALAIVLVEADREDHRSVYRFLPGLGLKLVRKPLLVSPALGCWRR